MLAWVAGNRDLQAWFNLLGALARYRTGDYPGCLKSAQACKDLGGQSNAARIDTAELLLAMASQQLRGMREVLKRHKPIVTTEVVPEWLERAGSNVRELVELMQAAGYEPYGLGTRRHRLRHSLCLTPCLAPGVLPPGASDVVWLPHDGALSARLAGFRAP